MSFEEPGHLLQMGGQIVDVPPFCLPDLPLCLPEETAPLLFFIDCSHQGQRRSVEF